MLVATAARAVLAAPPLALTSPQAMAVREVPVGPAATHCCGAPAEPGVTADPAARGVPAAAPLALAATAGPGVAAEPVGCSSATAVPAGTAPPPETA
ncbi:Uncharacterised protein [Mycobacterium tuberculosis]|nr:Uncharacterised protein [Mycobacterium tuberculosis]